MSVPPLIIPTFVFRPIRGGGGWVPPDPGPPMSRKKRLIISAVMMLALGLPSSFVFYKYGGSETCCGKVMTKYTHDRYSSKTHKFVETEYYMILNLEKFKKIKEVYVSVATYYKFDVNDTACFNLSRADLYNVEGLFAVACIGVFALFILLIGVWLW